MHLDPSCGWRNRQGRMESLPALSTSHPWKHFTQASGVSLLAHTCISHHHPALSIHNTEFIPSCQLPPYFVSIFLPAHFARRRIRFSSDRVMKVPPCLTCSRMAPDSTCCPCKMHQTVLFHRAMNLIFPFLL